MTIKHLRMRSILGALLGVAAVAQAAETGAFATDVQTDAGTVRGALNANVLSWKGIPFAAPPVGHNRWRAPQPPAGWRGVKPALEYRNDCMQQPFPSDAAPLGASPAEDCLYLNVWRPATPAASKLPVIVWIYGGGFVNGGASAPTYTGAALARDGVVFVSFNYRLGRFGTFAHPRLSQENADNGRFGNYGYMDQLAALNWVRRNITAFGGDAGNVTIMGESAGGYSVHTLATTPAATGLFHKAIVMSGGDGAQISGDNLATAEQVGLKFALSQGIDGSDAQALAKLRALSAEQVTGGLNLMAMFQPGPRSFSSPFVDGVISVDPKAAYQSGAFVRVPMMIGATSDDLGGRTGFMVAGAQRAAALIAGKGAPVYAYRFSYVANAVDKPGAGHASDVPFFLGTETIKYGDKTTPRDSAMARTITSYVVNFARSGNPNGAGLPSWPAYVVAQDRIMDFSEGGMAVPQKDPLPAAAASAAPQ